MTWILIFAILFGFLFTFLVMPFWIKKTRKSGLLWEDMNKKGHPKNVAASGGIITVAGFILSILAYLALRRFFVGESIFQVEIFALIGVILILCLVGLVDDLLGWHKGGLSTKVRVLLACAASIPLIVINAGVHELSIPFIGAINFGIFYPLVIIPLAVGFVTTTYNFMAGYNGLEAGLGVIMLSFLSFVSVFTGNYWLAIVGMCMVACLIGFLIFNWSPAKVFPGDILTYSVGALIISMGILGNFESIVFIIFIPFLLEVILKIRGKLKKQSFGKVLDDGTLDKPYDKIYSLTHLAIVFLKKLKGRATEKEVVYVIYAIEIIFILLATAALII